MAEAELSVAGAPIEVGLDNNLTHKSKSKVKIANVRIPEIKKKKEEEKAEREQDGMIV
ncbi:MAG: hypothetical protein PHR25_05460 [Clostridia bacterium]|nr:hypothetical protein [Clostridia bacterium]MDD4376212.1 hypothetical protein [Clostridia bacterium]